MMTFITAHKKLSRFLGGAAAAIFWVGVWQLISMLADSPVLLPAPFEVLVCLSGLVKTSDFWLSAANSLGGIAAGCLLGTAAGVLLAVAACAFRPLYSLLSPLISVIRSTPIASFILLALVRLKKDWVPLFIVVLMVLPIIWANVCKGIRRTDSSLLEVARVFRVPFGKRVRGIYLPEVMPYFSSAFVTAMGLSWKAGIAAEVLSVPVRAIGTRLYYSKIYIETAELFAWTLMVIVLSILLEAIFKAVLRRFGEGRGELNADD